MLRSIATAAVLAGFCAAVLAADKPKTAPCQASTASACCCKSGKCGCAQGQKTAANRVYQLRIYHTNPGKLTDLHKRFRDHTCALLKKHGAELVGFWTPQDEKDGKNSKLVYMVSFPSRAAAEKCWKEFSDDPEWKRVFAESHKNGVIVNKVDAIYLNPTDYSAMK
ncbi:MAG: NIPSNAP family protein [Isosphaeraceae bacterium]